MVVVLDLHVERMWAVVELHELLGFTVGLVNINGRRVERVG